MHFSTYMSCFTTKKINQNQLSKVILPRGETNSLDSISLSFLPLSPNGVPTPTSSYLPEVDVHTCAHFYCRALILLWAKCPSNLTPFVWSDLQRTPLGIPGYPETRSRTSLHSCTARLEKERLFHLPNILPFQ